MCRHLARPRIQTRTGERGRSDTMNSRFCRWLIVSALLITASGAWAQQSAPPASDQKVNRSWEATVRLSELQCRLPPAFDEKSIAAFKQQAASGDAAAQCGLGRMCRGGILPQRALKMNVTYVTQSPSCQVRATKVSAHLAGTQFRRLPPDLLLPLHS